MRIRAYRFFLVVSSAPSRFETTSITTSGDFPISQKKYVRFSFFQMSSAISTSRLKNASGTSGGSLGEAKRPTLDDAMNLRGWSASSGSDEGGGPDQEEYS